MEESIVTVVIPVYNNLPALSRCIASCIQHIDPRHAVVILDDCSTDPTMGDGIRRLIGGHPQYRYERSEQNLGFVMTCNRAVSEFASSGTDILLLNADTVVTHGFLEELIACLRDCDRHGVCCPRSNAATICTIPLRYSGDRADFPRISVDCWRQLKDFFPRYAVLPTGVGFCMLIRRELIDRFGLFDPAYGRGYNEENDFCCRINRCGYSVILANRAYVFHEGGGSFTVEERSALERKNRRILLRRYPEYASAVRRYFGVDLPAHEHFADLLGGCYIRKKVLIDLSHLIPAHNGTSEYALSILSELHPILASIVDVTILINPASDKFFGVSHRFPRVVISGDILLERFDLAFVPQQTFTQEHLESLNCLALRWVINLQDVIALRSHELRTPEAEYSVRLAARFADAVLSVSNASLADCERFLGDGAFRADGIRRVIHHGYPAAADHAVTVDAVIPRGPFLFLVGNHYEHKAIARAIDCLPDEMPTVVLGEPPKGRSFRGKDIRFLPSGAIDAALIDALYLRCSVVIFPSQYEGFGLPILHGASAGKPVIACDTEITREIIRSFGLEKIIHTFSRFDEIPALIDRAFNTEHIAPVTQRTWHDAAVETAELIQAILLRPVNVSLLDERFRLFSHSEWVRREGTKRSLIARLRSLIGRWMRKARRGWG